MLTRSLQRLLRLQRGYKRWLMVAGDTVMLPLALWSGFMIRLAEPFPVIMFEAWWMFPLVVVVGIPLFVRLGLYRAVVRFMGSRAIWAVGTGTVVVSLVLWVAVELGQLEGFPRSVLINFGIVAFLYLGGSRFLVRAWYRSIIEAASGAEPVMVYGAGEAGVQLLSGLQAGGQFRVVAFIDEDYALQGSSIDGVPVYGPQRIAYLVERFRIRRLLLAVPSASRQERRRILEELEPLPIYVQSVPSMESVVSGHASLDQLEDIDVADLLGRDPVPPDSNLLGSTVRGRVVMVTGAGGSIGTELCRQIMRLEPAVLVLYERNEFALYSIDREMNSVANHTSTIIHAVLGSVGNARRVASVLEEYQVRTLYHAAAYKHVSIVQANIVEGVRNNVLGTAILADAVIEAGVERFILISTDKAVRPANIMGATKRMAEMVLQDRARKTRSTVFSMVRFGNVLGSSGSVVPLFNQQIREGGPVTVTHPEVTRYFMSIPEAAELVIQAGAMAEGGEVYVLDMGVPVKIVDLARRMIRLHGRQVREDGQPEDGIDIVFTGLRPGEKLSEELVIGNKVDVTAHPRIMRAREDNPPANYVETMLEQLKHAEREMNVEATLYILRSVSHGWESTKERLI